MSSTAKLIQTFQYRTAFAVSLPKRRRSTFGCRVAREFLTRCSTKPGIGSDNVTSKNPGIELDPNSATETTSASPSLDDRALPSKHSSKGLVFGLGSDSSWDSAEIGSPVVKRYIGDDEERWYMWYYGRSDEDEDDSIGLATSSNGICWARGKERVASSGNVGKVMSCSSDWWAFDTRSVRPSDMVIMSSPMYSAVYWLYYTGCTEEEVLVNKVGNKLYKSLPGLACSQDGRSWARIEGDHHSGALLDVGTGTEWDSLFLASPKVVLHSDNDLRMYYHSYDPEKGEFGLGLARSRDGIRWVKLGKIMGSSGRQGSFDELGVVNAHVVRQAKQGRYLMAYEGVSGCGKGRSIGVAVSEDGLNNWTRLQDEPVLQPLEEDEWDNVAVSSPCLVQMEEDEWRLYYKGVGHRGTTGIGMAVSSGCDFTQFRRWQPFHL